MKAQTIDAFSHGDLPFERLVAELQPQRNLSRQPIFQVAFSVQNVRRDQFDAPGIRFSRVEVPRSTVRFDLLLLMGPPEGIEGALSTRPISSITP